MTDCRCHADGSGPLGPLPLQGGGGREGGWAVGRVARRNEDAAKTVEVEVEASDGAACDGQAALYLFYASDEETLPHRLVLDQYAVSADAPPGSWVLRTPPPRARGKLLPLPPLPRPPSPPLRRPAPLLQLELARPAAAELKPEARVQQVAELRA